MLHPGQTSTTLNQYEADCDAATIGDYWIALPLSFKQSVVYKFYRTAVLLKCEIEAFINDVNDCIISALMVGCTVYGMTSGQTCHVFYSVLCINDTECYTTTEGLSPLCCVAQEMDMSLFVLC